MNAATIRDMERASIREYVARNASYLRGRVLDFGAGKPGTCRQPEPYRDLVQGEYFPFDVGDDFPAGPFDAVLMTQVIQYLHDPRQTLSQLEALLRGGGALVITGPTNWAEVEVTDLWRFTRAGIRLLLETAGFRVLDVQQRAEMDIGGFVMSVGWGAVAVKP
jgi:SAM-dependent methyltransferase